MRPLDLRVVIKITPLVPLVPYIAAAAPSFNTSIDSMSSGATVRKLPGIPSIKINGEELALIVFMPRRII